MAPKADASLRHHPIFIVGAPRCGSTLAIQVIIDTLDVGYISNQHCKWHGAPALAERLFRPTRGRPPSDYQSRHGITKGNHSPAECGKWWYRFFRRSPTYITLKEAKPQNMWRFRRSLAALINACDRPVIIKNLYASLRIQAIAHYVPESIFIVIHRDEVDNGHSILKARYSSFQDYGKWFSAEPPDIATLKMLPPHEQVIEQIRHINKIIDHDLKVGGMPKARRFDLSYEDLCATPDQTIDRLQTFLLELGCELKKRGNLPTSFPQRNEVQIDLPMYNEMTRYARESKT